MINIFEVNETNKMIEQENLDVRTITMGISLLDCIDSDLETLNKKIYDKITNCARDLVSTGEAISSEYGIPIVNKRISVTPIALVGGAACKTKEDFVTIAETLDKAAKTVGVNFIGGYSALVSKGMTLAERLLIESIPHAMAKTERVCSSVNLASTKTGINMDAVKLMGEMVKETAEFMVDFVGWDPVKKVYSICAPVIPVQECHKAMDVCNPAFEVEYFRDTLRIAGWWAERLGREKEELWEQVAEHMAELTEKDGVYLAHENCPTTFTEYNRDHPSMLGAFGLIDSDSIDRTVMDNTLQLVEECWKYPTLWGWDFAMMAMTAVRLGKPEKAIELLLKESPKNCYVISGNNRQVGRKDLPLYLPGNGSLLLAAAIMTAGYEGCCRRTPGFPDDGQWIVEFENIDPLPGTSPVSPID